VRRELSDAAAALLKVEPGAKVLEVALCWKYALESTGFDLLVGSDGFDPLWCKSPNGPQML
jgi:hypothetical protein